MTYESLRTVAERTDFKQTGLLDEVQRLCDEFERIWPEAARSFEFGRSAEGRSMRALSVSRSGALEPATARAKNIPVLMIQGGIHPGESDGKDAGFIALRELLEGADGTTALDRIVVLFVPAFNTDGHERYGRWNRPNQNGPEVTGWRTNAQNLNLNRDYMKADTPEMRAMLHLINDWDPLVCADLHVTDGADFEPDISLQVEPLNQGDITLMKSGRQMRDALIARLTEQGFLALDFYPDLVTPDDPASGFALSVYSPRFSTGYFPQRNRFTMLVETHSWKAYAHRVQAMRSTVIGLAGLVSVEGTKWLELAHGADRGAKQLGGSKLALDYTSNWREPQALRNVPAKNSPAGARLIDFRGYAYSRMPSAVSGALVTKYDPRTPQIWRVPLRDQVSPSLTVTAPRGGYLVPLAFARGIAARLDSHGVVFEALTQPQQRMGTQVFRADQVEFAPAPFEGRMRAEIKGAWKEEISSLLAGALFVTIAQPLARLVVALFEPQAPDSFAAWGFFNACFEQKEHMEPYVAEQIAQEMLSQDPALSQEFTRKLEQESAFARSPAARLEFFLRRHASWDVRHNLYPVLRIETQPRS